MQPKGYLIIDIGTGNARVAITLQDGTVRSVATEDIQYINDALYPNAIYFDPEKLWEQIISLAKQAILKAGNLEIMAITATSQREGIVLVGKDGESLIGLPNIDHRGREWENTIKDKSRVYTLTGRYPTSLFSALKLIGIRERRMDIWKKMSLFLSISDWIEFKLSGIAKYEHSQASETLLYDVDKNDWSDELHKIFNLEKNILPPTGNSATVLGDMVENARQAFGLRVIPKIVSGGGDTQLAIKSTQPSVDDIVIVSGTTTPIVKLVNKYITDDQERTWTSRDIEPGRFIFEANAGVTGLNYQRLKEVFYPNETYEQIEKELAENKDVFCSASLGSLIANEKEALTRGGFVFPAPVSHDLTRSCFVKATLMDIAFSIAENYQVLREVSGHQHDYVWACGGGLQSKTLRQIIANIINRKVKVRHGFQQSSAVGGSLICNEALQTGISLRNDDVETFEPTEHEKYAGYYGEWKNTRALFRKTTG